MAGSTAPEPGGVFISYRRQETSSLAGRLYDWLVERFGDDHVFRDVDTIDPGIPFPEAISRAVASSQVLLALIGDQWLTVTDDNGRRRLDDPNDLVRLEIEAGLNGNVRVIPVLVAGARMPKAEELPESLAELHSQQAFTIRPDEGFRDDAPRLVRVIKRTLWGAPIHELRHDRSVNAVVFSPNGGLLATGSDDHMAHVWEVVSGQERRRVTHDDWVRGVAFSPDGRLLATGSNLGTAQVWELASGHELTRVTHDVKVWGVAFSPDGGLLATASSDGTARVWDLARPSKVT